MRARDNARLSAIRLLLAAIKQKEVDERIEATDAEVVSILERMMKQRRESISQFSAAGRADLAQAEQSELEILSAYLPQQLGEAELQAAVDAAVAASGASGTKDMGKVMAQLKTQLAGRADMSKVSSLVKARLSG